MWCQRGACGCDVEEEAGRHIFWLQAHTLDSPPGFDESERETVADARERPLGIVKRNTWKPISLAGDNVREVSKAERPTEGEGVVCSSLRH